MQTLRLSESSLVCTCLGSVGSAICVLTISPGDCDTDSRLRHTANHTTARPCVTTVVEDEDCYPCFTEEELRL